MNRYLDRHENFVRSIRTHFSRMGVKFDKTHYRLDLSEKKYEAIVKNRIRINVEKIKTELGVTLYASENNEALTTKAKDRKVDSIAMGSIDVWKEIEKDFEIGKRAFGKKINFVSDKFKRTIIFRDIAQAYVLANNGYSKPSVILSGSVIEELLRLYLCHKNIKLQNNTFTSYIKACEDKKLLKTGISKLSDSVRHFRNFVHLEKENSTKTTISKATAKGAVASIFTIANDF